MDFIPYVALSSNIDLLTMKESVDNVLLYLLMNTETSVSPDVSGFDGLKGNIRSLLTAALSTGNQAV